MKWLILSLLLVGTHAYSQIVQNFELTSVTDGDMVSLKSYDSSPAIAVIFYTMDCPYSEYYLERIKTIAQSYKGKIPVLLINSSTEEVESVDAMSAYARKQKLVFPYLADKEQKAFASLNPRKSPEVFLLQNASEKFKIIYRGAIDDNPQSANDVNHAYLREAIDKVLASQKIEPADIRPIGCSIKKN